MDLTITIKSSWGPSILRGGKNALSIFETPHRRKLRSGRVETAFQEYHVLCHPVTPQITRRSPHTNSSAVSVLSLLSLQFAALDPVDSFASVRTLPLGLCLRAYLSATIFNRRIFISLCTPRDIFINQSQTLTSTLSPSVPLLHLTSKSYDRLSQDISGQPELSLGRYHPAYRSTTSNHRR